MKNPQDYYNIALDCIDKHAQSLLNKHKTALIAVGAVRESALRLTYSNLEGLTNRFANALGQLKINPTERLILRLPNIPEFPISFLGAIKAGVIPIPSSPLLTWSELEFLLSDSEATALLTTEELLPKEIWTQAPKTLKQLVIISKKNTFHSSPFTFHLSRWQDLLKNATAQFTTQPTLADAPAFWLYTSGTTGKPKAVIHAHRSIRAHDERAKLWQDVKSGDVIFNTSHLNWSYALTCGMLDVWRHGLSSVIADGEVSPEKICEIVRRFGVTTFMSVPGIYRKLAKYLTNLVGAKHSFPAVQEMNASPLQNVRVCLSAGEKLTKEVRNNFRNATGLEIYEGLGMTEHSVYLIQPFGEPIIPDSCGRSLPGHRIAILREDLSEAASGEIGTLASHHSCPGLMLGYHEPNSVGRAFRPDVARVFRPARAAQTSRSTKEWFLSNDLAYRDQDGNFFFLGRNDDVINAGGYRISPEEIETTLNQHPAVEESAAVGIEIESGKTLVEAFVVLKNGFQARQETAKEILEFASQQLAKYKIPRQLVFLRKLPKTPSGKIQRRLLTTSQKDT